MRKIIIVQLFLAAFLSIFSCTKQEKIELPSVSEQLPVQSPINHWHYFYTNDDGSVQIKAAATIAEVPAVQFRPWTEALRIADCGIKYTPAVFLINKCGVYPVQSLTSNMRLAVQHELFSRASAGNLYTINGDYFIRIYQNSVFTPQNRSTTEYFLLRTDSSAIFYTPVASTANLHLQEGAQCKALEYAGGSWYASFKADSGSDVSFSYIKADNFTVFTQNDAFNYIQHISSEDFRNACEPAPYHQMPAILKTLADRIHYSAPLYLRVFTEDGLYGTVFLKSNTPAETNGIEEKVAVEANALYYTQQDGKHCAAILMPDGSCTINTSELGIQTIRLPALPENFVYTRFFISETHITAAWEEIMFYQVGRSGFFTAPLSELTTH